MDQLKAIESLLCTSQADRDTSASALWDVTANEENVSRSQDEEIRQNLNALEQLLQDQCKSESIDSEFVEAVIQLHDQNFSRADTVIYKYSPHYPTFVRHLIQFLKSPSLAEDATTLCRAVHFLQQLLFSASSPLVNKDAILCIGYHYESCLSFGIKVPSKAIAQLSLPKFFSSLGPEMIPFHEHPGVYFASVRYLQTVITTDDYDNMTTLDLKPSNYEIEYPKLFEPMDKSEVFNSLLKSIREGWTELSPTGSGKLSSLINILIPIVASDTGKYKNIVYDLLVELASTFEVSSIKRNALGQARWNMMKAVKNSIVSMLRTMETTEDVATTYLSLLQTQFNARIDVMQLQHQLQSRGMNVSAKAQAPAPKAKVTAKVNTQQIVFTPLQQAEAVITALHHYANANSPDTPIPNFERHWLPHERITDIVLYALFTFGSLGSTGAMDGGVSAWEQAIKSIKASTASILSSSVKAVPSESTAESEDAVKALELKKAKEKKIAPFTLAPDSEQPARGEDNTPVLEAVTEIIQGIVQRVAKRSGVLQAENQNNRMQDEEDDESEQGDNEEIEEKESDEGDLLGRLEYGVFNWLYELSAGLPREAEKVIGKRKRTTKGSKESETEEFDNTEKLNLVRQTFRQSRGFWSVFMARVLKHVSLLDQYTDKQYYFAHVISNVVVSFFLEDFLGRWDFAVRWLWEEHYHGFREGENYIQYDYWLCMLLQRIMADADQAALDVQKQKTTFIPWLIGHDEATTFRRFLTSLPRLPTSFCRAEQVPNLDSSLASVEYSGFLMSLLKTPLSRPIATPLQKLRLQLGVDILFDLISQRLTMRAYATRLFLTCCVHPERGRRSEAIRVARKLWSSEQVDSSVNSFVVSKLENLAIKFILALTNSIEDQDNSDLDEELLFTETSSTVTELPKTANGWDEETAMKHLDLYMVMLGKDPALLKYLLSIYYQFEREGPIAKTALGMLGRSIAYIGMPKVGQPSMKIVDAIESECPEGSEDILLRILQVLSVPQKKITESGENDLPPRLSSELVGCIRKVIQQRPHTFNDPLFWGYMLPGEGMSRDDVIRGLVHIITVLEDDGYEKMTTLPDEDTNNLSDKGRQLFVTAVSRLFYYQQQDGDADKKAFSFNIVTPADVLVLLHTVEIAPPLPDLPSTSLRQMAIAVNLCLQHPSFAPYFTHSAFAVALQKVLDDHLSKLPRIFMSTLAHCVRKWKKELTVFTTDVLAKVASSRVFKGKGRSEGDGKVVWEFWIRCIEYTEPKSFPILVQISRSQFADALPKFSERFRINFETWLNTRSRTHRVMAAIEEIDKLKRQVVADRVEREDN